MREIKFRAWDKKTKKMREVDSIAFHSSKSAFDYNPSGLPKMVCLWGKNCIEYKNIILQREPKNVILLQYTGLKDRNGKEIYDGDIIDIHQTVNGCNLFQVVWDKIGWSARYVQNEARGMLYEYDLEELFDVNYEDQYPYEVTIEVVGNIHENPELLEV